MRGMTSVSTLGTQFRSGAASPVGTTEMRQNTGFSRPYGTVL